jgi:hypothetical protein
MGQVSVREGEAVGLALRGDVAVRLRLSAVDRMWQVARWVVTLAGRRRHRSSAPSSR